MYLLQRWYQLQAGSSFELLPGLGGTRNRAGTHFKSAANLKADIFLDLHPWFQVGTEYIAGNHFEAGINLNP